MYTYTLKFARFPERKNPRKSREKGHENQTERDIEGATAGRTGGVATLESGVAGQGART